MVKTERATEATGSAIRSNADASVASRRDRVSRYATVAKMAAAIPAVAFASGADGAIYSQTGLSVQIGSGAGQTGAKSFNITGAGGAVVGVFSGLRVDAGSYSFAELGVLNGTGGYRASFKGIRQYLAATSFWSGGLPVNAGATWNSLGRTPGQFKGPNVVFVTTATGAINFGSSAASPTTTNFDPQGVGNTGATWYLLFKFTDGAASGNYGWLSFTANVGGYGSSFITVTGWGWDDSGAPIGAGVTASAVPGGTGLAALAFGATGLRGRRRSCS